MNRQTDKQTWTDEQTVRQTNRHGQINKQTNRQNYVHTDRLTDNQRQIHMDR